MISSRAPGSFQPGSLPAVVVDDGDDVDQRAQLDRIVDEMRAPAEPEPHHFGADIGRDACRRNQRAPRDAAAERRLVAMAEPQPQPRPQPVGADQRDAGFVRGVRPVPAGDRDAVAVHDEVFDARAELQRDVGVGAHRFDQRRLEVAAMGDPIGRGVALRGVVAERDAGQDLAARGADFDRLRRDRVGNAAAARGRARSGRASHWARAGCRRRFLRASKPGRARRRGSRVAPKPAPRSARRSRLRQ